MDFRDLTTQKLDEDVSRILKNPLINTPSLDEAIQISKKHKIALHPAYTLIWNDLSSTEFIDFLEFFKKLKVKEKLSYISASCKRLVERIGLEHSLKTVSIDKVKSEKEVKILVFNKETTYTLLINLGLEKFDQETYTKRIDELIEFANKNLDKKTVELLNHNIKIEIRDKAGTYIGARMGRPEKAKMRKLDGNPHGLFPIGHGRRVTTEKDFETGENKEEIVQNRMRNILESFETGFVESQYCIYICERCGKENLYQTCIFCSGPTQETYYHRYDGTPMKKDQENAVRYKKMNLDIRPYVEQYRKNFKVLELPKLVKGIKGTSNKHRIVEHLSKAFLREKNHVFVNKDGTVRFDMIEMGLTHFKPCEIGTSVEKLKNLGYTHDYKGEELTRDDQLIEILPQDVILPDCKESGDEFASDFIINTGNFVDEELKKLYKIESFYNFKTKEDTIGHLIIGLAPHTSAGIVGRIIGYSKTQGCFSHPVWHAAQRRNLDGDENGIMLLMDGLINFSRDFLPDRRGGRTMDVSLVLTSHLYLDQIDDEVHGMDIVPYYPLEFYRAAKKYTSPKEVKIEKVEHRLNKKKIDDRYLGYGFTHSTQDFNNTILCSSYKSVPTMVEKMDLQLDIATRIRAVNEDKVGSLIIDKHFMKDIKGNLRKFSMQSFRCTSCNTIYRRPPLNGKCSECNSPSINFTIHEGSIKKYLKASFKIIEDFDVDPYIVETLDLANLRIEGVFGKEKDRQKNLSGFFGK